MFDGYANYMELVPCDPQEGYESSKDIIGECAECGDLVNVDDESYTDIEDNLFCCRSCAIEHNGIKKLKRDDVLRFRERMV